MAELVTKSEYEIARDAIFEADESGLCAVCHIEQHHDELICAVCRQAMRSEPCGPITAIVRDNEARQVGAYA
ncbi:MAG: hypothetical protein NUW01_13650 [Gemmatimonadaceae bacterium]|nr:hypothetical protein [Gemmatimonadaceae bacterium]